jgi:hypothetical protein
MGNAGIWLVAIGQSKPRNIENISFFDLTGGESGIRTHDTEGRILALPATICSEMTGFPS